MSTGPIDPTRAAARRDVQTVTAAGEPVARTIDGVRTHAPVVHVDHRGRLHEIYGGEDDYWREPLVYCYLWSIRAGTAKGWGLHEGKSDRYTLIGGEMLTVLYDAREGSPTHGLVQRVVLTESGLRQVTIPSGVWHLNLNLAERETFLINHPTAVYDHAAPDRLLLPWDTDAIPVRIRDLFPIGLLGVTDDPCRHP